MEATVYNYACGCDGKRYLIDEEDMETLRASELFIPKYPKCAVLTYRGKSVTSDIAAERVDNLGVIPISRVKKEVLEIPLEKRKKVKVLHFGYTSLCNDAMPTVFQICKLLPNLEILIVYNSLLTARKTDKLGPLLHWLLNPENNKKLKYLDIVGNGISYSFLYSFFKKLNKSRKKKLIFIPYHGLSDINLRVSEKHRLDEKNSELLKKYHMRYFYLLRKINEY